MNISSKGYYASHDKAYVYKYDEKRSEQRIDINQIKLPRVIHNVIRNVTFSELNNVKAIFLLSNENVLSKGTSFFQDDPFWFTELVFSYTHFDIVPEDNSLLVSYRLTADLIYLFDYNVENYPKYSCSDVDNNCIVFCDGVAVLRDQQFLTNFSGSEGSNDLRMFYKNKETPYGAIYYLYTHRPDEIMTLFKGRIDWKVSDLVGCTMPPVVTITVDIDKKEEFEKYYNEVKIDGDNLKFYRDAYEVDKEKTELLRDQIRTERKQRVIDLLEKSKRIGYPIEEIGDIISEDVLSDCRDCIKKGFLKQTDAVRICIPGLTN